MSVSLNLRNIICIRIFFKSSQHMEILILIFEFIFAVLGIMLFVKVWKMTEDVKGIKKIMELNSDPVIVLVSSLIPGSIYKFPFGEAEYIGFNSLSDTIQVRPKNDKATDFAKTHSSFDAANNVLTLTRDQFKELYR